jgi:hypothetical protein
MENSICRFIGDIHGNMNIYVNELIKDCPQSIQVGDFGIGFVRNPTEVYDFDNHKFIRGNHDFPYGCTLEPNYIEDGHVEKIANTNEDIMFIGGAYSIDKPWRTEGIDYWSDEELSYDALNYMISKYIMTKPKVLIAHEVPQFLTKHFGIKIFDIPSRTRDALDEMFHYHKPELMISGHWHFAFDQVIDGCRHIILDCNHYIDIDLAGDCRENVQVAPK